MYPDLKPIGFIVYGLIFGLLPYLVFKTISAFRPNTYWGIIGACLSPLLIGPSFGIYHASLEIKELKNRGLWTKCIVIDEKYSGGKIKSWLIKCTYEIEDLTYETNYEEDKLNQYSIGDTLNLIYSKDYPKIYRLKNDWNYK
jgi:uncharacterized membrane protein YeaQ/YmgE (transglycosylase-associated protein family)